MVYTCIKLSLSLVIIFSLSALVGSKTAVHYINGRREDQPLFTICIFILEYHNLIEFMQRFFPLGQNAETRVTGFGFHTNFRQHRLRNP
jgi:hypothetical protein